MPKVTAYAVKEAKGQLEKWEYEVDELRADEVELEVTHCGICHSDLHIIDGDWPAEYPRVCGHEIVGTIKAAGGWQLNSCLECDACISG